jgi:5'-nucleotidase
MIILMDLDDVLAHYEGGFLREWRTRHPDMPYVPLEDRRTFRNEDQYPAELGALIREIPAALGFHRSLPLIPGAREALTDLASRHDVFICTRPFSDYENCVLEKYEWVEEHLGRRWTERMILTRDKTLVHGDILIDDNPEPEGIRVPTWEHIIFDRPYNRSVNGKRRITWTSYQTILGV